MAHPFRIPAPGLHRTLAGALPLTLALALPAGAQGVAPISFLDLLSPDRVATRLLQAGVMAARTVASVSYGSLSVSLLSGSATVTDLRVRAYPGIDDFCEVGIDRVRLSTAPLEDLDTMRLQARLSGVELGTACFSGEMPDAVAALMGERLHLPEATVDLVYTLSSGAVSLSAGSSAEGLAGLRVDLDFESLGFASVQGFEGPVAVLRNARIELENLGLWQKLAPMLPADLTDAGRFGTMLDGLLAQLPGTPADGPPDEGAGDSPAPVPALSAPRAALAESVKAAWAQFLADPQRLVLETGFTDGPRPLDFDAWKWRGPDAALETLMLQLRTTPGTSAVALLPATLLSTAYDAPDTLSDAQRLEVGRALATGIGAPRDLEGARSLLSRAAAAGSTAAAAALAQALAGRDDAAAYDAALTAAEAGEPGSAGLLDRLEAALPFAKVLALQDARQDAVERAIDSLKSLAAIRSEARMHLTGRNRLRSYREAALWAMLGRAAGDSESAAVLDDLDAMAQRAGAEGQAAWAAREREAAELARAAWTGFDLPNTLAGQ